MGNLTMYVKVEIMDKIIEQPALLIVPAIKD